MKPGLKVCTLALVVLVLSAAAIYAREVHIDRHNRTITAQMTALDVHVVGRVNKRLLTQPLPSQGASYIHQWPGIYFEAAFAGTAVTLKFDDAGNEYRLYIDAEKPIAIVRPGKVEITFSRLRLGRHHLRLEKVTESGANSGAFQGFYIAGRARPVRIEPRSFQMEFIGDSTITGYANRLHKKKCTNEEVKAATDTQAAFPALVAKHYGADYQVNAVSARGVIRNFAGILPGYTLPELYPFTLLDKTVPYQDPLWQPKLIFIKLNADFVGDLKPSERWANFYEVARDYGPAFGLFLSELHQRSPNASFVIWWFDTGAIERSTAELLQQTQKQIVEVAGKGGATKVHFMPMSDAGLRRNACDGHYSVEDHNILARRVIAFLDQNSNTPRPSSRRGGTTYYPPGTSTRFAPRLR